MGTTVKTKAMSIRLPQDLAQWIKDRSIRNLRSTNKEIVAVLAAIREGGKPTLPEAAFIGSPAPNPAEQVRSTDDDCV